MTSDDAIRAHLDAHPGAGDFIRAMLEKLYDDFLTSPKDYDELEALLIALEDRAPRDVIEESEYEVTDKGAAALAEV